MKRILACLILLTMAVAKTAAAQPSTEQKAFEVASIREITPNAQSMPGNIDLDATDYSRYQGGPMSATGLLVNYIIFAYRITDTSQYPHIMDQMPQWAKETRYHLEARPGELAPTKDDLRVMVRNLLADRFQLKIHTGLKEQPAYQMILLGKPGPGLQPHAGPPVCAQISPDPPKDPRERQGYCGPLFLRHESTLHMKMTDFTTGQIAGQLSLLLTQMQGMEALPIVDRTSLSGKWDLELEFQRVKSGGDDSADQPTIDFITALRTQAALKLVKGDASVLTYYVDSVHAPSSN